MSRFAQFALATAAFLQKREGGHRWQARENERAVYLIDCAIPKPDAVLKLNIQR
jgi:hypothetical protein